MKTYIQKTVLQQTNQRRALGPTRLKSKTPKFSLLHTKTYTRYMNQIPIQTIQIGMQNSKRAFDIHN